AQASTTSTRSRLFARPTDWCSSVLVPAGRVKARQYTRPVHVAAIAHAASHTTACRTVTSTTSRVRLVRAHHGLPWGQPAEMRVSLAGQEADPARDTHQEAL